MFLNHRFIKNECLAPSIFQKQSLIQNSKQSLSHITKSALEQLNVNMCTSLPACSLQRAPPFLPRGSDSDGCYRQNLTSPRRCRTCFLLLGKPHDARLQAAAARRTCCPAWEEGKAVITPPLSSLSVCVAFIRIIMGDGRTVRKSIKILIGTHALAFLTCIVLLLCSAAPANLQ